MNPQLEELACLYVLDRLDFVLLMTVNPGYAGQKIVPFGLRKIAECRKWLDERNSTIPIQVDGNVSFEMIEEMTAAEVTACHRAPSFTETFQRLDDVLDYLRGKMYEFDPTVDIATIADLTKNKLHPAGVRSFTYDDGELTGESTFQGYFEGGFDVVSANAAANDMQARVVVNKKRGVSPP